MKKLYIIRKWNVGFRCHRKECWNAWKIYFLLSILPIFHSSNSFAQQDPQYSQFWFTKMGINPAYAGINGAYCGTLLYRDQWTGFGGEPKTLFFSLDAPVHVLHGGLGLVVTASDQLGVETERSFGLSYAYRTQLGNGKLGIGISANYYQESIDGTEFIYDDPDNRIPTTNVSGGAFDLGGGIYYNDDNFYAGISSQHLQQATITLPAGSGTTNTQLVRDYYLNAGYTLGLSPALDLKPAILVKTDAVSTQADINADLVYNKFWGGLSYRLQDAFIINLGLEVITDLKVGFSYDLTTSDINTYSSGSFEIAVNYCHKFEVVPAKTLHKTVRFL